MAVDGRDEMRPEDARIAALYREAAGETPPERLDAAIRKHARAPNDAVKPQKHSFSWPAWRLPFVAAALAVVCASVVTLVMERDGERLTIPQQTPAPAPDSVQSEPPPLSQALRDRGTVELPSRASKEEGSTIRERAEPRDEAEVHKEVSKLKAPPTRQRNAASPDASVGAQRSRAADAASSADTATRGGTPLVNPQLPAPAAPTTADPMTARPRPPAEGDFLRAPVPATPEQVSPAPGSMAAPAAEPSIAPQAKPVPAPAPAAKPLLMPDAKALSRERIGPSPPQSRVSARAGALIAELENEPPARWVERILALRREDRRQDAEVLLAEFKRRFPTEKLPASLQQNDE